MFMNETLRDLAANASAYLKELQDRDVPYDLAAILVHDWHTAQLQGCYGQTIQPGCVYLIGDPQEITVSLMPGLSDTVAAGA